MAVTTPAMTYQVLLSKCHFHARMDPGFAKEGQTMASMECEPITGIWRHWGP